MIAQAMADMINADSEFAGAINAEQVADPKRRLEELSEGQSILDCIGQGASYVSRNRRGGDRSYTVWIAVHTKLRDGMVTNEALDEAGWWAERVQEFFHEPENRSILLTTGESVTLIESEPFPVSREQLFGHGLHMATLSFTWEGIR